MKSLVFGIIFLVSATAQAANTISIKTATFGKNSGAGLGNISSAVKTFCDGKKFCLYDIQTKYVDPKNILDPNKAKDFVVNFACSNTPAVIHTISIPNHSLGSKVRISCETDADIKAALVQMQAESEENGIETQAALNAAKNSASIVVIKYGATWCGPCRRYDSDLASIKAALKGTDVKFYHVDVDHFKGEAKGGGIPQLHYFKNGSPVNVKTGYGGVNGVVSTVQDYAK